MTISSPTQFGEVGDQTSHGACRSAQHPRPEDPGLAALSHPGSSRPTPNADRRADGYRRNTHALTPSFCCDSRLFGCFRNAWRLALTRCELADPPVEQCAEIFKLRLDAAIAALHHVRFGR